METLIKPKEEEQILAVVDENTTKEKIIEEWNSQTECCVDALCGCS